MAFLNIIRPDLGFVSPIRSDPGFVTLVRSGFCQRPASRFGFAFGVKLNLCGYKPTFLLHSSSDLQHFSEKCSLQRYECLETGEFSSSF